MNGREEYNGRTVVSEAVWFMSAGASMMRGDSAAFILHAALALPRLTVNSSFSIYPPSSPVTSSHARGRIPLKHSVRPPPAYFLSQHTPLAPALEEGDHVRHGHVDEDGSGDGAQDVRPGRGVPVSEAMRAKWMRCALHALPRLHISRFITAAVSGTKAHTSGGRK